ncbi:MAG: LysR family transcriptional regulator [Gemmataceae bacterium]
MTKNRAGHAYKEITLQQLRSFNETARLGSLKGAADALGLAHPTVWEQVHALERHLGVPLIEPHGRGCRLTEAGRRLVELVAPLVAAADALPRRFAESQASVQPRLTVATTQRTLVEDLPDPIVEFEQHHPNVQLCFREMNTRQVLAAVETGQADVGITTETQRKEAFARLDFEPLYELDHFLITPLDHPLAQLRNVTLQDLLAYPLVNAPDGIPDPVATALLDKLGAFRTQPRRIEAYFTAVIRRYVELGFGIGLVVGLPTASPPPNLHARSLSRSLGRIAVHIVYLKGVPLSWFARAFADLIRSRLGRSLDCGSTNR